MREQDLVKLEAICREQGKKLVAVRSYGLVGSLRVSCAACSIPQARFAPVLVESTLTACAAVFLDLARR